MSYCYLVELSKSEIANVSDVSDDIMHYIVNLYNIIDITDDLIECSEIIKNYNMYRMHDMLMADDVNNVSKLNIDPANDFKSKYIKTIINVGRRNNMLYLVTSTSKLSEFVDIVKSAQECDPTGLIKVFDELGTKLL